MALLEQTIDQQKLEGFLGKVIGDWGAANGCALALLGDRLGLYKAMTGAGPITPAELAAKTGTIERYVREWLVNQASGGYVAYDPQTERYTLPPEHAMALTDETSPAYVAPGFQLMLAIVRAEPRIEEAFRTGGGMEWGEHHSDLFPATERFFRTGYLAYLVSSWIPALDGVEAKLKSGATVADVGCGHGASTRIMAQAYPNSRFHGFDNHAPSIEAARAEAEAEGVGDRITFEVATAQDFPGSGYDLIAYFDCLHDMGDPVGAMRYARRAVADDGTLLIVEPMAGEHVEENINPVGRVFSGASVLCCTPNAIATGGPEGVALGTVATEQQLREVVLEGGFTRFRRATETPFNRIFEARP